MDEPAIEYPCRWQYKIIGNNEAELRAAVVPALGGLEHELVYSKESYGGKYVSMSLELEVRDEEHRKEIWDLLVALDPVVFLI